MQQVVKAIICAGDKYLLLKRSSDSNFSPDTWDFPGGKVDSGEKLIEALVREVYEETSLRISAVKMTEQFQLRAEGESFLLSFFTVQTFSGTFALSKDHKRALWIIEEELLALNLSPAVYKFFNH